MSYDPPINAWSLFHYLVNTKEKSQNSCGGNPYTIGYFTPCLILLEKQQRGFHYNHPFFSSGDDLDGFDYHNIR